MPLHGHRHGLLSALDPDAPDGGGPAWRTRREVEPTDRGRARLAALLLQEPPLHPIAANPEFRDEDRGHLKEPTSRPSTS